MASRLNILRTVFIVALCGLGSADAQVFSRPIEKRPAVKGRILGYSSWSGVRMVSMNRFADPPHDAFLFQADDAGWEVLKDEYIKLQYRNAPNDWRELPADLRESTNQRTIALTRDRTCDETMESFYFGYRFKFPAKSLQDLQGTPDFWALPGVNVQAIPKDGYLRCFSFSLDDLVDG